MNMIDIDKLKLVSSIAKKRKVTASYIYRLIKHEKLKKVVIDGVTFVLED